MASKLKKVSGDLRTAVAVYDFAAAGNDTVFNTGIFLPVGAVIRSTSYIVTVDCDTDPTPGGFTFNIQQSGVTIFSNGDTSSPVAAGTAVKDDIFHISDGAELILNYSGDDIVAGKFKVFVDYYLSGD